MATEDFDNLITTVRYMFYPFLDVVFVNTNESSIKRMSYFVSFNFCCCKCAKGLSDNELSIEYLLEKKKIMLKMSDYFCLSSFQC